MVPREATWPTLNPGLEIVREVEPFRPMPEFHAHSLDTLCGLRSVACPSAALSSAVCFSAVVRRTSALAGSPFVPLPGRLVADERSFRQRSCASPRHAQFRSILSEPTILPESPARRLYESLGFKPAQMLARGPEGGTRETLCFGASVKDPRAATSSF